jgi:uncharacterized metal-binding protein YceD (DUF177 family)
MLSGADRPWSVPFALEDIPEAGSSVDLVADGPAREAIAVLASLTGLPRLQARFNLTRQGSDGVHVAGTVSATVKQACVVTLEPVQSEVEETVDLLFMPPQPAPEPGQGGELSLDAAEPPEVLVNGVVDLGAVATEFLLLGIDPYPRKEGVVFDAPVATPDPSAHPFAALAALKKGPAGGNS